MRSRVLSRAGSRCLEVCLFVLVVLVISAPAIAQTQPTTSITLPIQVSLESLRQKIASDPGLNYVNLDRPEQSCIKESWISVSCVITGYAKRVGDLKLSGSGDQIELSFPIETRITAKTTSGIRSRTTVRGELDLLLRAQIALQPDWHAKLALSVDYRWNKPPTLKLLNMIKIPLRGYVDPRLDKEIAKLQAKAPAIAAELDLRSSAQRVWADLQRTQAIKGDTPLFFRFNPTAAFFSGIEVTDTHLKAALTLQGSPVLSTQKPKNQPLQPLPKLQNASVEQSGFTLATDIRLDYKALNSELDKAERLYVLDDGASIDVQQLVLSEKRGRLAIEVSATVDKRPGWLRRIDFFDWFVQSGVFEVQSKPTLEAQSMKLLLADASVKLVKGDIKTTLFADQILAELQSQLNKNMQHHYGDSLDKLKSRLNQQFKALGRVGEYQLVGTVHDVMLDALVVEKGSLNVKFQMQGDLVLSM